MTRGAGTTDMLHILSHVASRGLAEVMQEKREGHIAVAALYEVGQVCIC